MTRFFAALVAISLWPAPAFAEEPKDILNVSYDVSRELYADINKAFIPKYKADTGNDLTINQSHAGSSKQARAVLDGLKADVVTFNQFTDVQVLHDQGDLIIADWQSRLPNNSVPYYSLPAFLVRKGNPKNIKDWNDLVRDDVQVVFPNPKTSGNGRYTYLAAYAYALEAFKGDVEKTKSFVRKLFANVPVFDTGGRAATTTFVERGIGDVLVTFEAEVKGIGKQYGKDKVDLVIPPVSLRGLPRLRGRRARQPEDRRGLPAISLHAGSAGDHRHAFQPPDRQGRGGEVRQGLRAGAAVDRGGRVRRLEEGQRGAPRQWRHPRPALCEQVIGTSALHRL
jgi:sulfate transport system substrate-binding protein